MQSAAPAGKAICGQPVANTCEKWAQSGLVKEACSPERPLQDAVWPGKQRCRTHEGPSGARAVAPVEKQPAEQSSELGVRSLPFPWMPRQALVTDNNDNNNNNNNTVIINK